MFPSLQSRPRLCCGLDLGTSLTKAALADENGHISYHFFRDNPLESALDFLRESSAVCCGLTGGGSSELRRMSAKVGLPCKFFRVNEFAAWGVGSRHILRAKGSRRSSYVLISVGTGTSILLVKNMAVTRVGGTALGGGTIMGLGRALTGKDSFEEICQLAAAGNRARSDLLVSDVYGQGQVALAGSLTAANFGKLSDNQDGHFEIADAAASLMRMVGENVALIACGIASNLRMQHILFAGSTLRSNPVMSEALLITCKMMEKHARVIANGEFSGAVGALHFGYAQYLDTKDHQ